ncbi:aldehyde dehydrogenase family protein, partial [Deinococcus pimensis]|uniref:aldehyde dehydrogenase family protein n=1 Tax=Deinococcus pimensis TaxID=309888 RepID=UPI00146FABA7
PVIFGPTVGDVWLGEDVTPENFEERHAAACRPPHPDGHLRLVLGAGNHALLPVGDALEAVFLRGETVLVKLNPVNADMRGVVEDLFAPLLALGVVRVVTGGADVGAYLCAHEAVESVQLTGSDKTYDAVVFGPGEEGAARKARGEPLLRKPVTAELGGVSPTVVVPGPWSGRDVEYAAHGVAYGMTHNGGFNCNTTRLLVQHEGWALRDAFLGALGGILARVPTRAAYYPGAGDRWRAMTL